MYDCPGLAVIDYGSFPCTCNVPRFEIYDTIEEAKDTLESFVEELECNAQGNIDYKWRATAERKASRTSLEGGRGFSGQAPR